MLAHHNGLGVVPLGLGGAVLDVLVALGAMGGILVSTDEAANVKQERFMERSPPHVPREVGYRLHHLLEALALPGQIADIKQDVLDR